jgi:hypothetical protein
MLLCGALKIHPSCFQGIGGQVGLANLLGHQGHLSQLPAKPTSCCLSEDAMSCTLMPATTQVTDSVY